MPKYEMSSNITGKYKRDCGHLSDVAVEYTETVTLEGNPEISVTWRNSTPMGEETCLNKATQMMVSKTPKRLLTT